MGLSPDISRDKFKTVYVCIFIYVYECKYVHYMCKNFDEKII